MSGLSYSVGDRVAITAPRHPHRGESGKIVAPATRGPASVGLDWQVRLEDCPHGVESCFVAEHELRRERRGTTA